MKFITRKDVFNYFNTIQSVVSRKAINLRDIFDMDREFLLRKDSTNLDDELADEMYSNIMEYDFGDDKSMFDGNMDVDDY